MASTFHIFQDENAGKENRVAMQPTNKFAAANKQEKRPTLSVIGNVLLDKRDNLLNKEKTNENLLKNVLQLKDNASKKIQSTASSKVPVDQFKAFSVYEDENKLNVAVKPSIATASHHEAKQKEEETQNADESLSSISLREPLAELSVNTPMSIGGMSPMSVENKLNMSISLVDETADKTIASRSDLERFFDVVEYQHDILTYLKEAELKHRPKPGYMRKQPDITHSMRTILVDWLVEVGEEYRLQNETLCLAISYIDRFLSYMSVVRAKLQLVGTSAMFIASKYEEIYPPDVGEFVYITDDTYSRTQVLRMEQLILKVLSFDLSVPTSLAFITLYSTMNEDEIPEKVKHMTMYLSELALLEADPFLTYVPSKIAAAAVAIARHTLNMPMWTKGLEENIGYSCDDLKEIILNLSKAHVAAEELAQQAIQEKYKNSKFSSVAKIPPRAIEETNFDFLADGVPDANVSQMISSLVFN